MKRLIFILMCLALVSPLKAEEGITGTYLYNACTKNDRSAQAFACITWITGFSQGLMAAQTLADIQHVSRVTCFPDEFSGAQARLIIEKFMRDHPEDLHNNAATIAGFALALAFPCKK
jgi:hypothetical protein